MDIPPKIHLAASEKGTPYLQVSVSFQEVEPYLKKMCLFLNESDFCNYILNQKSRDEYNYHITVIDPIEYQDNTKQALYQTLEGCPVDYHLIGLGRVKKDQEEVFFVVIESPKMDNLRAQVGLPKRDFHVTLGFKHRDIHEVIKDRTTLIH